MSVGPVGLDSAKPGDRLTGRTDEDQIALDPNQPIIDAHHHLYDRPNIRYLLPDYLKDIDTGHDIRASVFVQARAGLRTAGPEAMRPVGETVFARAAGQQADRETHGRRQICAAIVGQADLTLAAAARPVLEAHIEAGEGRFRGVRHVLAWDPDPTQLNRAYPTSEGMMADPAFHAGFTQLAALGLSFDAWLFFHQIPRLRDLARAFPDVPIILNHCGGVLGVGAYAACRAEVFAAWSGALRDLAACPNVSVKLSGLGMPLAGFGFDMRSTTPSSAELAQAWRPWMETCIEAFGTDRAMFASNAPADHASHDFNVGWNAMKRLSRALTTDEKDDLFWRTATRVYGLPEMALKMRDGVVHNPEASFQARPAPIPSRFAAPSTRKT